MKKGRGEGKIDSGKKKRERIERREGRKVKDERSRYGKEEIRKRDTRKRKTRDEKGGWEGEEEKALITILFKRFL